MSVARPYDMSGMCLLTLRKLKGTEDELYIYVYVPAIRRVKRMSGTNRCYPYLGSDMTVDDGNLWAGLTNSMKWRFIKEKIGLVPVEETCVDHAQKMTQLSDGTWRSPGDQTQVKLCCQENRASFIYTQVLVLRVGMNSWRYATTACIASGTGSWPP